MFEPPPPPPPPLLTFEAVDCVFEVDDTEMIDVVIVCCCFLPSFCVCDETRLVEILFDAVVIDESCEDFFKSIVLPIFKIFKSNSKLQSHVVQIGVNEQNTLKHTEHTKPMSINCL